MKRYQYLKVATLMLLLLFFIPLKKINSIPAFARKYQISCQVCHSPVMPRLKGFGEEFAANGFRLTEYESPRYFIQTGDDKLSLFRELPLAFRLDGHALYNVDNSGKAEFAAPYILKILSGGELSDKLSYYFYFLMTEGGEIVGVEDAFLMYRDLFKTGINFYIGQFQASDPLFKGELRYTMEGYRIYETAPGNSNANLKYERGIMLERSFSSGTVLQMEVLNGCGLDKGFDTDKNKNFMFRLSQAIGDNLSLGLFAYTGKEALSDNTTILFSNKLTMFGPDVRINFDDKFVFNMQYITRKDSRLFDLTNEIELTDIKTQGGFAEIIFSPKGDMSKWYLTGLFNWVDSDLNELDYSSATLHAGYLLRRNLRLVSEYTWQFSGVSHGKVNAGFISAF